MAYSGNHPRFSAQNFDAKEAYNKDLTASARLHYLENDEHDKGSPARVMDEMHNGVAGVQQADFEQFSPLKKQQESGSAVYMTTPKSYRTSMSQHWKASNPSFDDPIAHDEAGRAGEGSPNMMVSPLNRTVEELQQAKTDMQKNRDDKKMGVKRYNKKVGRLNKKITRKGGEVPGNSPTEMHEGVKHDPDTKKESKTMRAPASPPKTKKSKLERANEKENTRLKEKVNSRKEKESNEKESAAMIARIKAKRDKDRENKSKKQGEKEMEAVSKRKSSEKKNNTLSQEEKIDQAKEMS